MFTRHLVFSLIYMSTRRGSDTLLMTFSILTQIQMSENTRLYKIRCTVFIFEREHS